MSELLLDINYPRDWKKIELVGVGSVAVFVLTTGAVVEERGCLDLMKSGRAYRYNISSTERNRRVIWIAPVPCTLTFFSTCLAQGGRVAQWVLRRASTID